MLLALGFATFGDLLDSPNLNAVNSAIVAEDSDADWMKPSSVLFLKVVSRLLWATHVGKAESIQIFRDF